MLRSLARWLHRERRKYDLSVSQFVTIADTVLGPRGLQEQGFDLLDWLYRDAGVLSEYVPRRYSDPEQPVVGVDWEDASAYCDWLTGLSGLAVTLPSEAQWEYAARGDDGHSYPWGGQRPDQELACFGQDRQKGRPDPVGSHPKGRGPFGALDQAGTVWEWCLDTWDAKAYERRKMAESLDPIVTSGDVDSRVLRGSSWLNPAHDLRAARRDRDSAGVRHDSIGFRVAVAPLNL